MATFDSLASEVDALIGLVISDPGLDDAVRTSAAALRPLAVANPGLALERLDSICLHVASTLARSPAEADMCRAVPLETFWRHHIRADVKAYFVTVDAYRDFLEGSAEPSLLLGQHLNLDQVLLPARHSWMVACVEIAGAKGSNIRTALGLRGGPPFVMIRLSKRHLNKQRVTVRNTRAVDAVPDRFVEWSANGLPTGLEEFVDGDVPVECLSGLEFVP